MKEIIDYFREEINIHEPYQVNVISKETTDSLLNSGNYDTIIMATGAVPAVPLIKGLKEFYWTEFLEDVNLPKNKKVLIIGGGLIGIEVASKLVDGSNQVVIVEMLDEISRGMEMIKKAKTLNKLQSKNVEIFVNHKVTEVDGDKVYIAGNEVTKKISGIDEIVIAAGMKSYIPFEYSGSAPIYFIVDANKVGKAQDAIYNAYELALTL